MMTATGFDRNNLDRASSPYLRQHRDNPIFWQEWSQEALDYARQNGKLIFVSVGYATCHWCHVMAHETFENEAVAELLNERFVAIKVDREQRPDIDQYLMSFLVQTQGSGGWPLNVFMTPDAKPFFAATYVGPTPRHGMPGFVELLRLVLDHHEKHGAEMERYTMPPARSSAVREEGLIEVIASHHDSEHGGFDRGHKFPPHCTLLFLLHYYEATRDETARSIAEKTLDAMATRGLHDHLQGGFFRYCVDRAWTIPHFEKMLYDQAMALWVYSAAFKVLGGSGCRTVARMVVKCLSETFEHDGLLYSAHDADTDGEEGATYLWTMAELAEVLTPEELAQFRRVYQVTEGGNFEGKNHLVKSSLEFLPEIEQKLLTARRTRPQPFVDRKVVTGWNALAGIALLMGDRLAGIDEARRLAYRVFKGLLERHYVDGRLIHSSLGEAVQREGFLGDYAAMLLFATYVHEETGEHSEIVAALFERMMEFKGSDSWIESRNDDFMPVHAQEFDHPTPSSVSLAELAALRTRILLGEEYEPVGYKQPLACDFFNIASMAADGGFHVIHAPELLPWERLPLNSLQVRSDRVSHCVRARCEEFDTTEALIEALGGYKRV